MARKIKNPGRHSRTKGHAFERLVAIMLRGVFPKARRHLENHEEDARAGADLIHTGRYRIQCKRLRDYAPINRIIEVVCDEDLGDVPVLITAGDAKRAVAVIPLNHFIELLKK